jgi:iduronate 2-sulfatase
MSQRKNAFDFMIGVTVFLLLVSTKQTLSAGCGTATSYPIRSAKPYAELKLAFKDLEISRKPTPPTSYQQMNFSSCTSALSFDDSVAECSHRSMRLCEVNENAADKCSFWTSTFCGVDESRVRMVNGQQICSDPKIAKALTVSCCADVYPQGSLPVCADCPTGMLPKPQWTRTSDKERGLSICAKAVSRPNVLFIVSDDLRYFDPDTTDVMPNLSQFAKQGVFFTNAHSQMAMCSPSRSSFLTGLRPDFTRLYEIGDNLRRTKNIVTLPQAFKKEGYITIGFGKIFDGRSSGGRLDQDFPQSWTVRPDSLAAATWSGSRPDADCGYEGDPFFNAQTFPRPFSQCIKQATTEVEENTRFATRKYLPDEIQAQWAMDKIHEFALTPTQPFFLALGFLRPHLPFVAPQKHFARWPRSAFPFNTTINGRRDQIYTKGAYGVQESKSYSGFVLSGDNLAPVPKVHERYLHAYHASCSYVDELLGKVVGTLREYPALADNTIIVFLSDHGFHLGEHEFYAKKTVYEQATHVPLLLFGASKFFPVQGIKVTTPVELVDLVPTLHEMAVLQPKTSYQGTSLVPFFRSVDRVLQTKSVALSQFNAFGPLRRKVMSYALRGNQFRYVVHWDYTTKNVAFEELYNYLVDSHELTDVKERAEHSDVLQTFRNIFQLYIAGGNKAKNYDGYQQLVEHVSTFDKGL